MFCNYETGVLLCQDNINETGVLMCQDNIIVDFKTIKQNDDSQDILVLNNDQVTYGTVDQKLSLFYSCNKIES